MYKRKFYVVMTCIFLMPIVLTLTFLYLNNKINSNNMVQINQVEFKTKLKENSTFFVYIGRHSCPDCVKFEPTLKQILSEQNYELFYYNTEAPASQKQDIKNYLSTLGVTSIPYILQIKNSIVSQRYDCQKEDDIRNFEKDLKGEKQND